MQYVGIDVAGLKRNQTIVILDENFRVSVVSEQVSDEKSIERLVEKILDKVDGEVVVAIDAPRKWAKGPGFGRKCEKEINADGIKIFYTPPGNRFDENKHEWMKIGMWFFEAVKKSGVRKDDLIEVFPSASYPRLSSCEKVIKLNVKDINRKYGQDILDASCAAITAFYYMEKRFHEYGDDEEGKIIVPRL